MGVNMTKQVHKQSVLTKIVSIHNWIHKEKEEAGFGHLASLS